MQNQECIVTCCVPSAIALHHPEWQPLYVWKCLQQFLPICEHSCRKTCNWDRDRVASHSNPCTEHICCEQHTGTCTGGLSPHWFCRGENQNHCSAVHPRKDPTHVPTVPLLSSNPCLRTVPSKQIDRREAGPENWMMQRHLCSLEVSLPCRDTETEALWLLVEKQWWQLHNLGKSSFHLADLLGNLRQHCTVNDHERNQQQFETS